MEKPPVRCSRVVCVKVSVSVALWYLIGSCIRLAVVLVGLRFASEVSFQRIGWQACEVRSRVLGIRVEDFNKTVAAVSSVTVVQLTSTNCGLRFQHS